MSKYIKKIPILCLFLLLGLVVAKFCHHATDGFALVNVFSPKGDNRKWDIPLSAEIKTEIDPILNNHFTYLCCGSQSYVFLSDDGKTVLKLFKFQHLRIPPWLEFIPLPKKIHSFREEKKRKKRDLLERTFDSFQIAYTLFKEETGLIFIHLNKTNTLKKQITIRDKIGRNHTLDLDQVEFILQKRGSTTYQTIDKWVQEDQIDKAKEGIHGILHLALKRCKKGIFDKDPDFKTNFGFVNEMPLQIDFGRFSLDPNEKNPEVYIPEMIRITSLFRDWIEKNHPNLLNFFNTELDAIINE